jgi:hypothetical protein
MPTGGFVLKYASGWTWCGPVDLFGDQTLYQKADDVFDFNEKSHWEVELIRKRGGNLRTVQIGRGISKLKS